MNTPGDSVPTATAEGKPVHQPAPLPGSGVPPQLGRYRLDRLLGEGGFGCVYLAHDGELHRPVAVKVPHRHRIAQPEDIDAYLAEARALVVLDHPNIVPVYDVGRADDGLCFVVSKFVEGSDLQEAIKLKRPSVRESAELVATLAEALHHAHRKGLVHRDVKPSNILLDAAGKPYVADFGVALREEDFGKGSKYIGTPAYMSPEQARGEGHRVDGRSDVFSLGVVFYELLTGRRPFRANTSGELLEQIATVEPRPPRQVADGIPKELERICLKALAKRASDRYTTALDLADDLRHFLVGETATWHSGPGGEDQRSLPAATVAPPGTPAPGHTPGPGTPPTSGSPSDTQPLRVVPKGLRAFDARDADFFLELLPGPRDREGLPETIRFWKARVEETDPDKTFAVGLIYGPSGCGKSSLVKAGLLPRLAERARAVYVEATPAGTASRLLNGLRRACPTLPDDLDLADSLAALRKGRGASPGQKVVIVLDQFEQWLHARTEEETAELVQALRQCDGPHVQCLLLVRDDFWMSITHFLRDLEIPLQEGRNSAAVDLFDPRHARKVLATFGRAFGALPEGGLSAEQEHFLDRVVAELAQEGKVVPVRLAVFAEMVKGKAWTPATLGAVGGTQGVGVAFLEEKFDAATAPPGHRRHAAAARAVLQALLPERGGDIKGRMKAHPELLATSGYAAHPNEFDALLGILDEELRLVTPADPEGADGGPSGGGPPKYYQLTHDYLVHAIRAWLTARQRQTHRGRAGLRLAERAADWAARPEARNLPGWWDWLDLLVFAPRAPRTDAQRAMMAAATRRHAARGAAVLLAVALAVLAGLWVRNDLDERRRADDARALVAQLLVADIDRVPGIIEALGPVRRWADPDLQRVANDPAAPPRERLRASLALLGRDEGQLPYLLDRLLASGPEDLVVIRRELSPWKEQLTPQLWARVEAAGDGGEKLRAASALAEYDPDGERWPAVAGAVAGLLVREPALLMPRWSAALRPARLHLIPRLAELARGSDPTERAVATGILVDYAEDDTALLAELIKDADPRQYAELLPRLGAFRAGAADSMRRELGKTLPPGAAEADKARLAERQRNAAVTLYRMAEHDALWPLFRFAPDPRLRSHLIHALRPLGADPGPLIARWGGEPEVSARRALLLALGEFAPRELPADARERLTPELLRAYRDDPDAGLHGAAGWLLRRWGAGDQVQKIDKALAGTKPLAGRPWFVSGEGHTMVVVAPPADGPAGAARRPFAIAAREVSIEQFLRFRPDYYHLAAPGTEGDYPVNVVNWFDAVAYCRWLSEREGVPEDQMCYPPLDQIKSGMRLPADYARRTGYRLPTEWEWELACRAGTTTSRYFGESDALLAKYASYQENSGNRLQPSGLHKPNDLGLFDMLGGTMEWCHGFADAPGEGDRDVPVVGNDVARVTRGGGIHHRAEGLRCTQRDVFPAATAWHSIGFRVVRTQPEGAAPAPPGARTSPAGDRSGAR